ncbi:MAG: hypothetical protein E5V21_14135, partial [Mesorhizobium sp.]
MIEPKVRCVRAACGVTRVDAWQPYITAEQTANERLQCRGRTDDADGFRRSPDWTEEALELILTELDRCGLLQSVSAVGHQIVHGGRDFTAATILEPPTLEELRALAPLA